jgi:phosphoglycerate kinase
MLRNEPVAQHLSKLLGIHVAVARECIGPKAKAAVDALKPGEVVLLENLRFHAQEEENDEEFARQLAALADVYVNDAFGTAHRAHASIVGVPKFLPAVAGLLLEKEVTTLGRLGTNPERPLGLVLGGAKIADKIAILNHLCDVTDVICVGGGVGNTFLKARGIDVADSLVDDDGIADAKRVLSRANGQLKVVLPSDAVAAFGGAAGGQIRTVPVTYVPSGWRILDLGPATLDAFHNALAPMRTIVWNGPVGLFEHPPFDIGSLAVARMLAELDATTIVGGGETAAAVQRAGVAERMGHVSTGGGASLAMLQGKPLPGVEALNDG